MKKENSLNKNIMVNVFIVFILIILTVSVKAEQPEWPLDFSTNINVLNETIHLKVENGKLNQAGFSLNKFDAKNKRFEVVSNVGDFSSLPTNIPELEDQNRDIWYYIGDEKYEEYQNLEAGKTLNYLDSLSKLEFWLGGAAGYTPELTKDDYNLNYANYRNGVLTLSVDKYQTRRLAAYEYDGYPYDLLEASVTEEIKYRFLNRQEKSSRLKENQAHWNVERKVNRQVDIFNLKEQPTGFRGFMEIGSFSEAENTDDLTLLVNNIGQTVKSEADLIDPVGQVSYVYGIVHIKKDGSNEWIEARQGDQLMPGDLVRTGRRSKLEINHKKAKKIISVSATSELMFTEELKEKNELWDALRLFFGFIYVNGKEIEGELNVHTPQAVCGSRGTVYSIEVEDGTEVFSVYEGSIVLAAEKNIENIEELDNDKLDQLGIFLKAGQKISIDKNGNFSEIENLTETEINEGIKNSIMK